MANPGTPSIDRTMNKRSGLVFLINSAFAGSLSIAIHHCYVTPKSDAGTALKKTATFLVPDTTNTLRFGQAAKVQKP